MKLFQRKTPNKAKFKARWNMKTDMFELLFVDEYGYEYVVNNNIKMLEKSREK